MANYFRRAKGSKIYFLPAWAATNPTSGEIAAGTDLSPQINGIDGFKFTGERIDAPVLSEVFTRQIDGPNTASDSSLTFLDDDATSTVFNLLAKGTAGFIALMPHGNATTKRVEKWPVKVISRSDEWTVGNEPARFGVDFAVTSEPIQNGVLP